MGLWIVYNGIGIGGCWIWLSGGGCVLCDGFWVWLGDDGYHVFVWWLRLLWIDEWEREKIEDKNEERDRKLKEE